LDNVSHGSYGKITDAPLVFEGKAILASPYGFTFSMTSTVGERFDLHSFDAGFFGDPIGQVTLTGYRDGTSVISETFTGIGDYFETIAAGAGWSNLDSILFNVSNPLNNAGAIDNIRAYSASAIPLPAAVWLFGSALAGLGWLRRKHPA